MKVTIVLLAIFACAFAAGPAAVKSYQDVPILRSTSDIDVDGTFKFGYETGDGTLHDAAGNADGVQGRFAYTSPEGEKFEVTYVADGNGFQAQGAHIPQVPAYIARALDYIRTHPPKEV